MKDRHPFEGSGQAFAAATSTNDQRHGACSTVPSHFAGRQRPAASRGGRHRWLEPVVGQPHRRSFRSVRNSGVFDRREDNGQEKLGENQRGRKIKGDGWTGAVSKIRNRTRPACIFHPSRLHFSPRLHFCQKKQLCVKNDCRLGRQQPLRGRIAAGA